jgi:hypothetical protein
MFQLTGLYLQPARVFFMHIHAARYKCGFNKNKNKKKLHLPGSWFCIAFGAHALGLAAVHPAQRGLLPRLTSITAVCRHEDAAVDIRP